MKALRIEWGENEAGWGFRPDGYSLHTSEKAAATYLADIYNNLPAEVPDEYDYPSNGWREPAIAYPVEIADGSELAKELTKEGNLRVFRSFDGVNGERYRKTSNLEVNSTPVTISYGETPFSEDEKADIEKTKATLERAVAKLQHS
ncbi:MAG: hypothetical protein MRY79_04630 [Alphaproteobacteria bacterium]|nr:hypothetical protein [Alphaproteobacteria bacterium]